MQQMTRIDEPATDAGLATVYANGLDGRWGDDTFTSTERPDGDLDVEYLDHLIVVQGDSDPIRPYATGVPATPERVNDSPTPTMSTPATMDAFVRFAAADSLSQTTVELNSDDSDGTTVREQTWADGDGVAATLYTVRGGGRTWPHAALTPAAFADYGRTSRDIDASQLAVDFVVGAQS